MYRLCLYGCNCNPFVGQPINGDLKMHYSMTWNVWRYRPVGRSELVIAYTRSAGSFLQNFEHIYSIAICDRIGISRLYSMAQAARSSPSSPQIFDVTNATQLVNTMVMVNDVIDTLGSSISLSNWIARFDWHSVTMGPPEISNDLASQNIVAGVNGYFWSPSASSSTMN
ncbi:hypothetical protein BD410DRAFT_35858 [Rickenella mellea]|uniref:Uncharacterized protein n=1 Tax=Rickenella mellea TaxID=50990 RepID=A0A4R5XEW9_9AGAM|nr:hypothetical protein BD410DRAFT_35858 [Rickenella mellea]